MIGMSMPGPTVNAARSIYKNEPEGEKNIKSNGNNGTFFARSGTGTALTSEN